MLDPPLTADHWRNADPATMWSGVRDEDLVAAMRADRGRTAGWVLLSAEKHLLRRVRSIGFAHVEREYLDDAVQLVGLKLLLETRRDANANILGTGHHVDFSATVRFDFLDIARVRIRNIRLNPTIGGTADRPEPEQAGVPNSRPLSELGDSLLNDIERSIGDPFGLAIFQFTREEIAVDLTAEALSVSESTLYKIRKQTFGRIARSRLLIEGYEAYLDVEREQSSGPFVDLWKKPVKARRANRETEDASHDEVGSYDEVETSPSTQPFGEARHGDDGYSDGEARP